MMAFITEYPQFFTASIFQKQHLLKNDKYKDYIVDSLRFLVNQKRVRLFSFAIMSNHLHLIWQMQPLIHQSDVQRDFLKYTAQHFRHELSLTDTELLSHFRVDENDRIYRFWKRRPLSIELRSHGVFRQKLEYIHSNPVKAGLCRLEENYHYSSARFYFTGVDNWGFLSHYNE